MSRTPKPKPEAAAPAPNPETVAAPAAATTDPAKATSQVAPDPTGAAVAAAASVDPHVPSGPGASPEPANDPDGNPPSGATPPQTGPEGWGVKVVGPAKGRWRLGRHFTPEPVVIPAPELTETDMAALYNDPELVCAAVRLED